MPWKFWGWRGTSPYLFYYCWLTYFSWQKYTNWIVFFLCCVLFLSLENWSFCPGYWSVLLSKCKLSSRWKSSFTGYFRYPLDKWCSISEIINVGTGRESQVCCGCFLCLRKFCFPSSQLGSFWLRALDEKEIFEGWAAVKFLLLV